MERFTLADLPRYVRRKRRSPQNVWGEIATALNPAYFRPKLAPDVQQRHMAYRSGEPYTMMKASRPAYIRLTEEDRFLVDLMDGKRTVKDIVVAHFQKYGRFALSAVTNLIEELRRNGFLAQAYVSIPEEIARSRRERGPRLRVAFRKIKHKKRFDLHRANEITNWLYAHGGRYAYTKTAGVLYLVLTIGGVFAATSLFRSHRFVLFGTSAATIIALYVIDLLAIFIHEAAHALTCRHFGLRVNAAGLMQYLGMPLFFIDTSDTWMGDRHARVWVSWSGPYSGFIIGGACAIAAVYLPTSVFSAFLYRFAIFSYYGTLQNLVPFLRLDGYYIMMDLIDTQNLRERAFAFVRHELVDRLRVRARLTREEKLLALYGLIAFVFAVLAILVAILFWSHVFRAPVVAGWHRGLLWRVLLLGLAAFILAAPIRALLRLGREAARRLRFLYRRVQRAAQRKWRADAADLFGALPLMRSLDEEARTEIAERVELRRVAAGQAVVVQGEPGSEFFLVRSGLLEVTRTSGGQEIRVKVFERGDAFGELALLNAAPRSATVRALEPSEVFALDKGTFDRLLAQHVDVSHLRDVLLSMEAVRELGPFANLDPQDLASLAASSSWEQFAPKAVIVRQGKEGEAFYVIAAGQVEVLENRKLMRTLGQGEYFGEVALLLDIPRTATVRALTPVKVLKLEREGFERAVAQSFKRGTLKPSSTFIKEWEH